MKRINSLAIQRPLAFSFAITLLFILLVLISSIVVGRVTLAETLGWYAGSTIGRLVSILILLAVLWRLGWLHTAGFSKLGGWQTWFILVILLQYAMMISAYVMTGSVSFGYSRVVLTGTAIVFIMLHAFLEEIAFRGLVMHSLVRTWDHMERGVLRSVLVSSLFYAGYHSLYLAGEPFLMVVGRIIVAFLLGILFGGLVLNSGSMYSAAFFHGVFNVAGYLNLTTNGVEATSSSWLLMSLFMLPLAFYGLYLLRGLPQPFASAERSLSTESPVR
jgi:membrane protease YdiL (CAAX protease family)